MARRITKPPPPVERHRWTRPNYKRDSGKCGNTLIMDALVWSEWRNTWTA